MNSLSLYRGLTLNSQKTRITFRSKLTTYILILQFHECTQLLHLEIKEEILFNKM